MTKAEIARIARLPHPTVSTTLNRLKVAGEVFQSPAGWSAHPDTFYVIGISIDVRAEVREVGGGFDTSCDILGVLTDRSGNEIHLPLQSRGVDEVTVSSDTSYEHVRQGVCDVVKKLHKRADQQGLMVAAVGVEMGGHIDARGRVIYSPNLNWSDKLLSSDIERETGLPCTVENDANAFAWWQTFSSETPSRFAIVLLSESIGAALVERGRVLHGSSGGAGELGHLPLGRNDELCQCGRVGCLQTVAGATAIRHAARQRDIWQADGSPPTVAWLVDEAEIGATEPREILEEAAHALAHGITAIECLFDPDRIFVLSADFERSSYFRQQLDLHLRSHLFPSLNPDNIEYVSTEPRNGALGAAWAAILADPRRVPAQGEKGNELRPKRREKS
jgi:predicted NBD/HSP70 family sugar kinase